MQPLPAPINPPSQPDYALAPPFVPPVEAAGPASARRQGGTQRPGPPAGPPPSQRAPSPVWTPPGGIGRVDSYTSTSAPTSGPSVHSTLVPTSGPSVHSTLVPTSGPSVHSTLVPNSGPSPHGARPPMASSPSVVGTRPPLSNPSYAHTPPMATPSVVGTRPPISTASLATTLASASGPAAHVPTSSPSVTATLVPTSGPSVHSTLVPNSGPSVHSTLVPNSGPSPHGARPPMASSPSVVGTRPPVSTPSLAGTPPMASPSVSATLLPSPGVGARPPMTPPPSVLATRPSAPTLAGGAPAIRYPAPGDVITSMRGNYHVRAMVGQGRYGTVYEVLGPFDQRYALKLLVPANRHYAEVQLEWRREAERLLLLRHPGVVYLHDAFEANYLFYMAFEWCPGSLSDLLVEPLGPELAIELTRQILAATQYLHDNDVVHDDLHSGNVLFTHADRPVIKIADFGISKELRGRAKARPEVVHHAIMAPEVVAAGYTSRQSDIYQVGLLLYWMVTGKPPLDYNVPYNDLVRQVSDGLPRQRAEQLNTPLGAVIAKMLRRRDAYRYGSARDVWEELRDVPEWLNRQLFREPPLAAPPRPLSRPADVTPGANGRRRWLDRARRTR